MTITPADLQRDYGCHGLSDITLAVDAALAAPSIQAPNSGIPALFTTWTDPKVVQAITTPTKSEAIYGTAQKGDWTTDTAQFPFVEFSGNTSSYGDYSQDGTTDPNANWEQRQSYHYQTWTKWGEREVERMGTARLDWVNQKNLASLSVLNKTQNRINLFGVTGMRLFGALNDPDLPAALQPTPKLTASGAAAPGNSWADVSDPLQVWADILKMYQALTVQLGGNLDMESPLRLVIPSERQAALLYTNQYNLKLRDIIAQNLPNCEIHTLPEAGAQLSGGLSKITQAQLFVREIEGQETVTTAFTEKLRAHTVERYSSNVRQKKSQGTWGTIWFRPVACTTMAGV
ncbi:DUF2184 domain-containing protein [Formicincola oecophyllae]|uniref:DUF2184 domain-containing protein n=1 Tax=Formicincola oecophyllae TaxID=2558361 RepID=A0A4Y6UC18_9PROT|nr:DUF2184 domain-containing protein [Formicincola oecophyllae]QDH14118.1 DUF2184 domain-containing protein [Formicincola oecophyllae]